MSIDLNKLFNAKEIEIEENVSNIDDVLEYEQILLSISKTIIEYRKKNNLTQKDLAKILNNNQVMISKLERGDYNPTIKLLYKMSRKLTHSSDLLVDMLKDIITNLYKSKSIQYTIRFKKYETYEYNTEKKKNNITYLVNEYSIKDNYGGMVYGEINNTGKFSVNR